MSKRHRPREQVYVVLRADLFHGPTASLETLITAKAVLSCRETAEREVGRLNALRPDGQVRYWVTPSRILLENDCPSSKTEAD